MIEQDECPGLRALAKDFVRALGFHDENGGLLPGAFDEVASLLKHFVTHSGKLPLEVRDALGAAGYGRKRLLRLILRAFVGPEPDICAWRTALAAGGFKLVAAAPPASDQRSGTPGIYLPRALQRIHSRAPRPCHPADRGRVHSDTAVHAAVALGVLLQRACGAAAAMGPALVLLQAADRLTPRQWRLLDAHLFDEKFQGELAEAIGDVLLRHPIAPEKERTNAQVVNSVRGGAERVEQYFTQRESELVAAAARRIQHALRQLPPADGANSLYEQIARDLRSFASTDLAVSTAQQEAWDATNYLREIRAGDAEAEAQHRLYLQRTMRDLVRHREPEELQLIYQMAIQEREGLDPTGDPLDEANEYVVFAIRQHAAHVGPPPIGTPAAHIPIFERQAIALAMTEKHRWQAGQQWLQAGLLGSHLRWMFQ